MDDLWVAQIENVASALEAYASLELDSLGEARRAALNDVFLEGVAALLRGVVASRYSSAEDVFPRP